MTRVHGLSVAGSDSSGGAGLEADLRVFAKLGVPARAVCTARTEQTAEEVRAIHPVPSVVVRAGIYAALEAWPARILKTGMLWSVSTLETVAQAIGDERMMAVVDPVMQASSGRLLVEDRPRYLAVMRASLMPRAFVFTPNLDETSALLERRPHDRTSMIEAAKALQGLGARNVVIKGGHLEGDPEDVLLEEGGQVSVFRGQRVPGKMHGTGCRFASAIAAYLALGRSVAKSVEDARAHALDPKAGPF